MIRETYALTVRELKHWYRVKVQILMALVQPIVWLGLFGQALNLPLPASQLANAPNFFSYMSIGMLAVITLFTCMFGGFSLVWDRRFGFLTKLRVAPISRGTVPLSRIIATTIRSITQAVIVFLIALAFVFVPGLIGLTVSPAFNVLDLLGLLAVLVLLAVSFSAVFISIAISIENMETLMAVVNLLNLPIMFASAALFPTSFMPDWMKVVVNLNPLTWAVDAARIFVFHNPNPINSVWVDIVALTVFAGLMLVISYIIARKQLSAN